MPHTIKRYGWIPDLPDNRDHLYAAPIANLAALPAKADLRGTCPPVYDQGELGSCTANAIAAAVQFDLIRQVAKDPFPPSRLFIYYNERVIEGTAGTDSGAMIRDGIKSVASQGNAHEVKWPYLVNEFAVQPPPNVYAEALLHTAVLYQRVVADLGQMKGCLASGFPFVFGFSVYESFESADVARSGNVPMPAAQEKLIGGHAVMAVGYDDASQRFIVRNSWGDGWGIEGYFTMPYTYLTQSNLSDDFWTIRIVQ